MRFEIVTQFKHTSMESLTYKTTKQNLRQKHENIKFKAR